MKRAPKLTHKYLLDTYSDHDSYHRANDQFRIIFEKIFIKDHDNMIIPDHIKLHYHSNDDIALKSMTSCMILPDILFKLLSYQQHDGSWHDIHDIINLISLKPSYHHHIGSSYQQATSYALAIIRQHIDYFDMLHDAHDRGYHWLSSSLLNDDDDDYINASYMINAAREVIVAASKDRNDHMGDDLSSYNDVDDHINSHHSHDIISSTTSSSIPSSSSYMPSSSSSNQTQHNLLQHHHTSIEDEILKISSTPTANTIDHHDAHHHHTYADDDEHHHIISQLEQKINATKTSMISVYIEITALVDAIYTCSHHSIISYHRCNTIAGRNEVFEELNCRLGDGYHHHPISSSPSSSSMKPSSSSSSSWKSVGVPGLRPKIIIFFNHLHTLANIRRQLIHVHASSIYHHEDDIWTFKWNDEDVVERIIHCLDKLRTCRELYDWYGRSYSMICNPLMLTFDMMTAIRELHLHDHVKLMKAKPHHPLTSDLLPSSDAPTLYQLDRWRDKFQHLCYSTKNPNAPTHPYINDDDAHRALYIAMMTMIISYDVDKLQQYHSYEHKFLVLCETSRGTHLLDNQPTYTKKQYQTLHLSSSSSSSSSSMKPSSSSSSLPAISSPERRKHDTSSSSSSSAKPSSSYHPKISSIDDKKSIILPSSPSSSSMMKDHHIMSRHAIRALLPPSSSSSSSSSSKKKIISYDVYDDVNKASYKNYLTDHRQVSSSNREAMIRMRTIQAEIARSSSMLKKK